jgi:GNAT superfamily N-acetyltransferase
VHLLLALDMPSRVSRFMYAAGDDSLIEHGRRALSNAAWLAGAFVDGRLRGIAEVYDIGATGGVEAAFVVDRRWRRRGLGTALLQASQHWAAASKRAMIRGVFSRSNWPMRRLARTANARLDLGLDEVSAEIPVAARE